MYRKDITIKPVSAVVLPRIINFSFISYLMNISIHLSTGNYNRLLPKSDDRNKHPKRPFSPGKSRISHENCPISAFFNLKISEISQILLGCNPKGPCNFYIS